MDLSIAETRLENSSTATGQSSVRSAPKLAVAVSSLAQLWDDICQPRLLERAWTLAAAGRWTNDEASPVVSHYSHDLAVGGQRHAARVWESLAPHGTRTRCRGYKDPIKGFLHRFLRRCEASVRHPLSNLSNVTPTTTSSFTHTPQVEGTSVSGRW